MDHSDLDVLGALAALTDHANAQRRTNGRIINAPQGRHCDVRLDNGAGVVSAYCGIYEPIIGARVALEQPAGQTEWRLAGVADYAMAARSNQPYDIERIGTGIYYPVALEAINHNSFVTSDTGLSLTLYNVQWIDSAGQFHYLHDVTVDLSSYVPISDAVWAVIYIDAPSQTLAVAVGVNEEEPDWVDAVQSATGAGRLPILAVLLEAGTTNWPAAWRTLHRGFLYDTKKIISIPYYQQPATGGGGGAASFTDLNDVPADYAGAGGYMVTVNNDEDGLIFTALVPIPQSFLDLTDTPSAYGDAGDYVAVNNSGDGLVFISPPAPPAVPESFTDLDDTPSAYTGAGGQVVTVNGAETGLEFTALPSVPENFTDLDDTPNTLGTVGQLVAVNGTGDALEFINPPSGGSIEVTDGTTSVNPATTLDLDPDAFTLNDAGAGVAEVGLNANFVEVLVEEIVYDDVLASAAATVAYSLPNDGIDAKIYMRARSSAAAVGSVIVSGYFNNDTTATNYRYQLSLAQNGAVTSPQGSLPRATVVPAAGAVAGFGDSEITVPDYLRAGYRRGMRSTGIARVQADVSQVIDAAMYWNHSTNYADPVTSVSFSPETGNFVAGSRFIVTVTRKRRVAVFN